MTVVIKKIKQNNKKLMTAQMNPFFNTVSYPYKQAKSISVLEVLTWVKLVAFTVLKFLIFILKISLIVATLALARIS